MRILVYDVAASDSGAKSVLLSYYDKAKTDFDNTYLFVTSVINLSQESNIDVLLLPWAKKSWFHRLYADIFYMPKFLKKNSFDKVFSLQNVGIRRKRKTDFCLEVFNHNAIPFTEHRFSLFKEPFLWIYQNVIGAYTIRSLKKTDSIIVQTNWMKKTIAQKCKIDDKNITVQRTVSSFNSEVYFEKKNNVFFYPATAFSYKNHDVIIKACELLMYENTNNFKIVFTITGKENKYSRKIFNKCRKHGYPIEFVGCLNQSQMQTMYSSSILLFPSYLETIGLPLIEAAKFKCPIICSDLLYSHEALDNYENVAYINYKSADVWKEKIKSFIC